MKLGVLIRTAYIFYVAVVDLKISSFNKEILVLLEKFSIRVTIIVHLLLNLPDLSLPFQLLFLHLVEINNILVVEGQFTDESLVPIE